MSGLWNARVARPGASALGRAAACVLALWVAMWTGTVAAQEPGWVSPVWEQMPLIPDRISQTFQRLDFLNRSTSSDPSLDTLVVIGSYGLFRYAPGETNGAWGAWRQLAGLTMDDMLVTSEGTILFAHPVWRSIDAGQTWHLAAQRTFPIHETQLSWLREQAGGRAVVLATGGQAANWTVEIHVISFADGEPGSWIEGGPVSFYSHSIADVPESTALPNGRLLHSGDWVMYSDDGAMTWHLAELGTQPATPYNNFRFAFLPRAEHPYDGVVFGINCGDRLHCEWVGFNGEAALLWRSDDGGASWTMTHEFTSAETGIEIVDGIGPYLGVPFAGPDGALWAAINKPYASSSAGRILRSIDEGQTWHHADTGFGQSNNGRGWRVHQIVRARDGRLYAATDQGVWRTTQPVPTSAEASAPVPEVKLSVVPNPSRGRVTLTVETPAPLADALVDVFTVDGRIIHQSHHGALAAGTHRFEVNTTDWAAGTYVARVQRGTRQERARFTVVR